MDKKVKHNKFKIGKLTFTLPNNKPTDELFQQWKQEFLSVPETNNYKVWLTGGYLEDWETTDIDLILTGKPSQNYWCKVWITN